MKDGRVFRAGAPEDIFTRETIGELYGLQHVTFNERFGLSLIHIFIIDKLKKRDGITIDNMTEALDRCVEDGVKEIVVQPTRCV